MHEYSLQEVLESPPERLAVILSDRQATTIVLALRSGEALPERSHVRGDVTLQVLAGQGELSGFRRSPLAASDALFIPCGQSYAVRNSGESPLVLLFAICPGVTVLQSRPYGSAHCPLCSAEVAIEEGDVPGDRIICPDCTAWMRIVETDHGYDAEPA